MRKEAGVAASLRFVSAFSKPQRGLVELDLVFAADLVGQLFPGGGDAVATFLRRALAGEGLVQLVFRDGIILEDARNAWLDGGIRVVVGVLFRIQVRRDEGLVV